MKRAKVIPLYKGRKMDYMVNYHSIFLLITISKLLEEIIHTKLYNFLDKNGTLFLSQYGFKQKHSCEQAILEFIGSVLQAKNRGEHTAFDTLKHEILLSKLEKYWVRGTPLNFFRDYLIGHSLVAKVTMNNNETICFKRLDISHGIAQGSCLSPLLFIIFVNDIHLLPLYSRIILFADDTTIFNSLKSQQFLK